MPTFIRARLPPAGEQQAHDRSREQELRLGRDADAVPAAYSVEELLAAHPEPGQEMLEVGRRRCRAAEHGGIERAAPGGEQTEGDETAADLEAPVRDVLVRYLVAGDVQRRAEQESERARAHQGADGAAGCDVERDDHTPIMAYALRR